MKKNIRELGWLVVGLLFFGAIAYAQSAYVRHTTDINGNTSVAYGGGAYEMLPGQAANITGPDGVCKTITDTSSTYHIFVPVNSSSEWYDFYTNPGPFASVQACPVAPASCSINLPIYEYATGAPSGQQCGFGVGVPSPHVFSSGTTYTARATGASVSGSYSISCNNGQLVNQTWTCTYGAVQ